MRNSKSRKGCPFCDLDSLKPRIFYNQDNWIGFLAAPYHTKGHAILAAYLRSGCPDKLEKLINNKTWSACWSQFGIALKTISKAMMEYYKPKDILIASVRGDVKHFHFHLIPLYAYEEEKRRKEKQYEKGHLFEFLGDLEKDSDHFYGKERDLEEWTKEYQRHEITERIKPQVWGLRSIIGKITSLHT